MYIQLSADTVDESDVKLYAHHHALAYRRLAGWTTNDLCGQAKYLLEASKFSSSLTSWTLSWS